MTKANRTRTCSCCGKPVTQGYYLWDDKSVFCSDACAAKALDNDPGCVDILIDAGRLVWME